jgi:hypothetical protein
MILIAPDARAGVVVPINSDAAGASELASQLLEIVLGLPPGDHKGITVDPKLYDRYLGGREYCDASAFRRGRWRSARKCAGNATPTVLDFS